MRRAMLAALGVAVLALTVPGAALAHHHGHRGRHHNVRSRAHHARVHFEHIGASTSTSTSTSTPTTPTPTPPEELAKVSTYENGVLTLTLPDGSTVKGKVTSDTRIRCVSANASQTDEQPGDDRGAGDDEHHEGDWSDEGNEGDDQGSGDNDHQESDQQGPPSQPSAGTGDGDADDTTVSTPEPPCDSSALTAGAQVREAELRIGPSGNEFESIELVR